MESEEQARLDKLSEIAIRHHEELAKIEAAIPGIRETCRADAMAALIEVQDDLLNGLARIASKYATDASAPIAMQVREFTANARESLNGIAQAVRELMEAAGKTIPAQAEEHTRLGIESVKIATAEHLEKIRSEFAAADRPLHGCGQFSSRRRYRQNEVVSFMGSSYIANEDGLIGEIPGKSRKWTLLARRGLTASASGSGAGESGGPITEIDGGGP